ncbi:ABC transporter permease [Bradyrhizobium sp.]|uniref:ABC transporter permease n=1 Tax=Bradyrhizobium sp. TaxID=376 RepID=UPI000A8792DB|nr:ABC transporter permease [Bradyrhizobium sp.]
MSELLAVFLGEFRRIFALRPVFSVLVVGSVFYAVFYPQPYLNEALRNVPIAIVDGDGTVTSRELARRVDATADVAVTMVLPDIVNAEREVLSRTIFGILVIPKNFERDLLHGRASPIALYADASYFLVYQSVSGGVVAVARTLAAEAETARLIGMGVDPVLAGTASDPLRLTAVPLFNPQGGYATYVLPGAFVLLLQQILLMGVGLLGTLPGADPGITATDGSRPGPLATVGGKMLAYLLFEAFILPLYLIALPYFYGLPRLGGVVPILILAVPFVLSVSGLGLVVAAIFRSPLRVQLVLATIGLPFFFLAGFAWPTEVIPDAIHVVSLMVPSTSAIGGFTRLAQLGATLADVRSELLMLWGLAIFYGGVACILQFRERRRYARNAQTVAA